MTCPQCDAQLGLVSSTHLFAGQVEGVGHVYVCEEGHGWIMPNATFIADLREQAGLSQEVGPRQ